MNSQQLQKSITNIYNHLYANSEKKTPQGISVEVGKILHTGMYLEEFTLNKPAFIFNKSEEKHFLQNSPETYAKNLQTQYQEMNKAWKIYEDNSLIQLKDFDLVYTCIQLNGIEISDPHKDVFGDSLEIFRSQWAKQIGGQFFTDPLVTKLSMKLLNFDPRNGDDLVDICSGTGGFLLAGINHIKTLFGKTENGNRNLEKEFVELAQKSIIGQEYDKEVCAVANSTIRARIGSEAFEYVSEGDSLDNEKFTGNSKIRYNSHSCIAGNPPFGTKITIKDSRILQNYELARVKARQNEVIPSKLTPRAPDILFLEQNVKLLKPGEGRLSLVVPYQILSGPQALYIRKWLLLNTIITSVIDLPADTFQPHTGTKGCLLTLKRRKSPLKDISDVEDHEIFMSTPKWIGHDRRGNPVFRKNIDGKPTGEILSDFSNLEEAYELFTNGEDFISRHSESFTISVKSVLDSSLYQLNAQFHKPSEYRSRKIDVNNWEVLKIKDVAKKIFYPGRFERGYVEYFPGAIPFYGGKEITQMVVGSNKWISPNHPKIRELEVKKGWILITRSGTTGIISIVPEAWDGFAMSEHVIRIIPDESKLNPFYLLAFLKTNYCQDLIGKGVYGSVIDSITPEFIGNIEVRVPKNYEFISEIIDKAALSEENRNSALLLQHESINNLNKMLVN